MAMSAQPAQQVHALVAPVADRHGLDLLAVEVKGGRGAGLVRIVVDAKGGVALDTCRQVSSEVSRLLDEDDPLSGRYTLEVTSPGLDWPLRERADFDRVEGRTVDVCHSSGGERVTQVTGAVVTAEDDAVVVDAPDGTRRIAYADIVWAKQTLPW